MRLDEYKRLDFYQRLNIPRDADLDAIKSAARVLFTKYHEDKTKDATPKEKRVAKEMAGLIGEAYNTLKNEKTRREYDDKLKAETSGPTTYPAPSVPEPRTSTSLIAFGDVIPGSQYTKTIIVENIGSIPEHIDVSLSPNDSEIDITIAPGSVGGPFPLAITLTLSCSRRGGSGARNTSLLVLLDSVSLKVPVTYNVIIGRVEFTEDDAAPDDTNFDFGVDDADSDYPHVPTGAATGGSAVPPPADMFDTSTAYHGGASHTKTSAPAVAASPDDMPTPQSATVLGWFVGFVFYIGAGVLIALITPMLPHTGTRRLLFSLATAWQLCSGICIGIMTTGAICGKHRRVVITRRVLLVSSAIIAVVILPTMQLSFSSGTDQRAGATASVQNSAESNRLDNKVSSSETGGFIIPPNTVIFDDFNSDTAGSDHGITYGVSRVGQHSLHYAAFTQDASTRIEYPRGISDQGTLEFWVYVTDGYYWHDSQFFPQQQQAMIFSTDAYGGDVTWPGTAKLMVSSNGDVSFYLAENLGGNPPTPSLEAKNTGFTFNQWHAIGISYGSEGQAIMVDGNVVARQPNVIQKLGAAGDHQGPLDIPTIGETVSHFFPRHTYDGGFDGFVGLFRASSVQQDWYFARGVNDSYFTAPSRKRSPMISTEDQREHQLVQQAQELLTSRNYDAALTACNEALTLNAGDQSAIQLKSQIQQAMQPTGTGTDTTTRPAGTSTASIDMPPPTNAVGAVQTSISAQVPSSPQATTVQQWLALAEIQFEHNDYTIALQDCNTALQLDPQNSQALQLKAKIEATMRVLGDRE